MGMDVEGRQFMKWYYRVYFCLTAGLLLLIGGLTVITPNKEFSDNENRVLAKLPAFQVREFLSGEYQTDLEKAVDDQTIGRDHFTALATYAERKMGYRDIGGTYLGKEDTYLTKTTTEDIDMFRYMENLRYVEYLSGLYPEQVSLMLVPSAGTMLSEKLPKYAPYYQADPMYHAADVVCAATRLLDLRKGLQLQKELLEHDEIDTSIYFRTDHHWTLPGAYQGYVAYVSARGRVPKEYQEFAPEVVTRSFYGTLYSKVLDRTVEPDVMYAAAKVGETTSVVCDGNKQTSIYQDKKLDTKDKYAYFFGGNYAEVKIKTKAEEGGKLVIFKDSFANSMVPFLLQDYAEITMIDLRYYRKSVAELLEQQKDAEILVLYEMSNFAQDANLVKLSK